MTVSLLFALLGASLEADVDARLDAAFAAEKAGDCVTAGQRYEDVLRMATNASAAVRVRVQSVATSRLARTETCRKNCQVSDEELALFATAKEAVNEPKRVEALCQQLLRGKNTTCPGYAEIRAFCPAAAPVVASDPCRAPAGVLAEVNTLPSRVLAIDTRAKQTKDIDTLASIDREIDTTRERLFELRERFLYCDRVHHKLVAQGEILSATRAVVAQQVGDAYLDRMSATATALEALKTERIDNEKKLQQVSRLNDAIVSDVLRLVQTRVAGSSTQVEGARLQDEAKQAALTRALQGEREALEQVIASQPEFFGDASPRALEAKREELKRLDTMLVRYAGHDNGSMQFAAARAEVDASLALLDNALAHATHERRASRAHVILYGFGLLATMALTFVFARRRHPEILVLERKP